MQLSNLPARILQAFANAGSKNTIPQTTVTPGAASFNQGFPALTMTPLSAGGVPPAGQDFNGILYALSLIQQWQSAGGTFSYDSAWSTANNGYPKGAVLMRADGTGFWLNTTDNNTADPDGATPTGWVPEFQDGITAVTGLTNANVTLTSLQYGRRVITLAGTLTGNVQIIFPAFGGQQWLVVNNTTGNFSVTAKTAAGTGAVIAQAAASAVYCDGTNISAPISSAAQSGPRVVGLVGGNNAGTPNTQFDFACNSLTVVNVNSGASLALTPVGGLTCNILTAGPAANGRDQAGALTASSWVHFWYIYNPTTATLATLASLSSTAPTMPAGYSYRAYIGAVYLSAGSALANGNFRGAWFHYSSIQFAVSGGTSTVLVAVPVPTLVPPNALEFELFFQNLAITSSGAGNYSLNCQIVTQVSQIVSVGLQGGGTASTVTGISGPAKRIANLGQSFAYQLVVTSGAGPTVSISVGSYNVPNGG